MNYLRSELYRTMRIKALYIISATWVLACIFLSSIFINPPIGTFSNADYGMLMFMFISLSNFFLALLVSSFLSGKNLDPSKQSISFGISKRNIYVVKFFFSISFLLILLVLLEIICSMFSLFAFSNEKFRFVIFQIKFINMMPLLASSLALCQWLNFSRINGIVTVIAVFGIYLMSSDGIQLVDNLLFKKQVLTNYFPSGLLERALHSTKFEPQIFFIGLFLLVLFLTIGYRSFSKKDVA